VSEVEGLLNDLKFHGIKESLGYRMTEAIESNLTYQDFLTLLLDDEKLYRRNKRSETLRRRAHFKDKAYLEEFNPSVKRGVTKSMVQQLKTLNFISNNENLIFVGGTGAGKTFLAQALGHAACASGVESFFISANRLFREVEIAEVSGLYLNYLKRIRKAAVLIIDDLGLRNYSHKEATVLLDILEDRYQKSPIIITSQIKPQGWKTLFEDEVITEAILDRITSCAHIVEVKGESYRSNHKVKNKLEIK
jgi:DNA replication protein DnaC